MGGISADLGHSRWGGGKDGGGSGRGDGGRVGAVCERGRYIAVGAGKLFNDLFFHVNRDDSVAVATGVEPKIWPEDAVERPRPGK